MILFYVPEMDLHIHESVAIMHGQSKRVLCLTGSLRSIGMSESMQQLKDPPTKVGSLSPDRVGTDLQAVFNRAQTF